MPHTLTDSWSPIDPVHGAIVDDPWCNIPQKKHPIHLYNDPISTMILEMIWTCNWNIGNIISISFPQKKTSNMDWYYIYISSNWMIWPIHPIYIQYPTSSNIIQVHLQRYGPFILEKMPTSRVFLSIPMVDCITVWCRIVWHSRNNKPWLCLKIGVATNPNGDPMCSHRNDQPAKLLRCFRRVTGQVVLLWIPAMFRWRTLFTAPFLNLRTLLFLCRHAFLLDPFCS